MKRLKTKILRIKIFLPVVIGVISGWFVYGTVNLFMYQYHFKALSEVKANEIIIDDEDVALKAMLNFNNLNTEGLTQIEDFTYRVSKSAGLIRADDTYNEIAGLIKKGFKANKDILLSRDRLTELNASSIVISLISKMGASPDSAIINSDKAEAALIRLVGRFPSSLKNYDTALKESTYDNVKNEGYALHYFNPFVGNNDITNHGIIERLLAQYRLSEKFVPINSVEGSLVLDQIDESLEVEEEYKQTKELVNKIIFNWQTSNKVSYTRDWIMVFRGPMQWLMFMLFFTAIYILFLPLKPFSDSQIFEEQRSEVFIFCEETMPILGFIGTIMGLMLALSDAYKIPIASPGTGSALAISSITNTLAMAFTTTLMAFTLKIVLDLIKLFSKNKFDFITRKEGSLVSLLAKKINPLSKDE